MGRGFTIIEVVVAIFILTVGAGATFALSTQSTSFLGDTERRLVASYLAQEGLEITRNIRDGNLLEMNRGGGGTWKQGLTGCSSGCGADYDSESLSSALRDDPLVYNGTFWEHDASASGGFRRVITVTAPTADLLKVAVRVSWTEQERTQSVTAETELTNWFNP